MPEPAAPFLESSLLDWPALGYAAACRLLGPPNPRWSPEQGSSARWGQKGSFWLSRRSGHWHDFESGQGGDVLDLIARETALPRREGFQWLRQQGLLTLAPQPQPEYRRRADTPPAANPVGDLVLPPEYLQDLWREALPVPAVPWHPVRRWLEKRQLWPPEQPLPPGLAWLPRRNADPETGSVGRLLAALAPLPAWLNAADNSQEININTQETPAAAPQEIQALQTLALQADGAPALDRPAKAGGLDKRTLGPSRAAVYALLPETGRPPEALRVVEGLADALALGSRRGNQANEAVIATAGAGTWRRPDLARALAELAVPIYLHPDPDPAGRKAAQELTRLLAEKGAWVETAPAGPPGLDPAALAARDPFPKARNRARF